MNMVQHSLKSNSTDMGLRLHALKLPLHTLKLLNNLVGTGGAESALCD